MTIIESYHAPPWLAFNVSEKEVPDMDKDGALEMSVNAINNFFGQNGLVTTLLVFDALRYLSSLTDMPTLPKLNRAIAIREGNKGRVKKFPSSV